MLLPAPPLDDLVGKIADRGARGIETDVRLRVRDSPRLVQALELEAVGGQRAAPVARQAVDDPVKRRVDPEDRAVGLDERAKVGIDERPAAGRDHHVAGRQELLHDLPLDGAEVRLAVGRENRRDRPALASLDALVDILDSPAEPAPDLAGERGLAGGHEPDQVDLVRPHWQRPSSVSKKPGYEIATDSAPQMRESPRAPSAAMAKAIASR